MTIDWEWYEHYGQIKDVLGDATFSFHKHEDGQGRLVLWKDYLGAPLERILELSNGKVTVRPRGDSCCELTGVPSEIISLLRSL